MGKKLIFVVILALTFSACAKRVWVKPGATAQEFAVDRYNCEKDARQSGYYGGGLIGALEMQAFFNRCMESKGYILKTE